MPLCSVGFRFVDSFIFPPCPCPRLTRRSLFYNSLQTKSHVGGRGAATVALAEEQRCESEKEASSSKHPFKLKPQFQSRRQTVERRPSPSSSARFSKAARRFYNERFSEPQRLSKVLAAAGVASRRSSEEVVFAGRVTVNGAVCKVPQTLVDPLKDNIYIDGCSLPKKLPSKLYFALNKPKGYICSNGENESKSVLSLFEDYLKIWVKRNPGLPKPRLFTVGRLDVATSGLIFVTNDGEFAFSVSHPSSGLTKEYIATVKEKATRRQLQNIAEGTLVQGVHCVPVSVDVLDGEPGEMKQRLKIVVSEGRNHEVRHLLENAGLEITALKRIRIGGFRLPQTLGLGKHQPLTEAEVRKLLDNSTRLKQEPDT